MFKKSIIGIIIVAVCIGGYYTYNRYDTWQQNYNTSTNEKPIGQNSLRERISSMTVSSFDDLLEYADLVVEGEVVSDGVLAYDVFPKVVGTPDDHELNIKDKVAVTLTQFKVSKVLYGELETDLITVYQFGTPETDVGELKIKQGQKLICFLRNGDDDEGNPFNNTYPSVAWEEGFYDITNEKSTRAFSNVNGLCKFDNKPSSALLKEIENVVKRSEKLNRD